MRRAILVLASTTFSVAAVHSAVGQPPAVAPRAAAPNSSVKRVSKQPPAVKRPLEGLVQQHIMVLPVQYLTFADSLGWAERIPSVQEYLATLDDELTFALGERGVKTRWTFAEAITRSVKRNPELGVDPHAISAEQVRMGSRPDNWQLHEPLASQVRSLVALSEARYVLFPVEVRVTSARGIGSATLHVVLIDARLAQVQWAGDVHGRGATAFTPALAADLASRLADLVAPPAP